MRRSSSESVPRVGDSARVGHPRADDIVRASQVRVVEALVTTPYTTPIPDS